MLDSELRNVKPEVAPESNMEMPQAVQKTIACRSQNGMVKPLAKTKMRD